MADRGILFSAPMVLALLAGRKTQTRRLATVRWVDGASPTFTGWRAEHVGARSWQIVSTDVGANVTTAHAVGDRLWVREAWSGDHGVRNIRPSERPEFLQGPIWYWADGSPAAGDWEKPRPSLHMPRWASRLTLTVTDVRVQRLQEITHEDAAAEGCPGFYSPAHPDQGVTDGQTPAEEFEALWNSLHGADAWAANHWVVAYTFTVEKRNIDR